MGLFNLFKSKQPQEKVEQKEISTKSSSPFVDYVLSGSNQYGFNLSPQMAFWLYEKSDAVGDAIDRISSAFQQITPILIDKKTNEIISKEKGHPLLDLLSSPGPQESGDRLKYELMTSLLATGECYPVLIGDFAREPIGIYEIPANYTSLIEAQDGWLGIIQFSAKYDTGIYRRMTLPKRKLWIYQHENGMKETIQILMKRRRHSVRAQSVLERIYYQAITKFFGNVHNSSIMKNAGRPGGLFSPGDGSLSQDQYEAFKNEVREKFSGPTNAGKNIVAPKPVNYQNLLLSARDMDFINLIENSRIEIYTQYQIPLPLVLAKTMTLSNYTTAIGAFYDMSVLPRAKFLLKQIGNFALPRYKDGDRYELTIDEKEISALKERLFQRAKLMNEVQVYSVNEIRSETAYEGIGPEGDQVYRNAAQAPIGDDDYTDDNISRGVSENE